jgi:hypothetical protein
LPASGLPFSGLPFSGLPFSGLPFSGLPVSGLPVSTGPPARFEKEIEKLLEILLANLHAPKFAVPFCVVTHAWLTGNEFKMELAEIID